MSGAQWSLALSVFLACAVEAVEAFTIVLAVGTTRRWRAALAGVGAATLVLAVLVAALGPALTSLPIGVLRVVVGGLLYWRAARIAGVVRGGPGLANLSGALTLLGGIGVLALDYTGVLGG